MRGSLLRALVAVGYLYLASSQTTDLCSATGPRVTCGEMCCDMWATFTWPSRRCTRGLPQGGTMIILFVNAPTNGSTQQTALHGWACRWQPPPHVQQGLSSRGASAVAMDCDSEPGLARRCLCRRARRGGAHVRGPGLLLGARPVAQAGLAARRVPARVLPPKHRRQHLHSGGGGGWGHPDDGCARGAAAAAPRRFPRRLRGRQASPGLSRGGESRSAGHGTCELKAAALRCRCKRRKRVPGAAAAHAAGAGAGCGAGAVELGAGGARCALQRPLRHSRRGSRWTLGCAALLLQLYSLALPAYARHLAAVFFGLRVCRGSIRPPLLR
jgi:hypothetical protein